MIFISSGLFDVMDEGIEKSVNYYNNWVKEVKEIVPAERLLVYSVKEGWEPICRFLDLQVPDQPFPNVNDSNVMKKKFRKTRIAAWFLIFGVPVLFGLSSFIAKTIYFDL